MSYGDYSHRETPPSNNVGGGSAPKEPQESKVSKFFSSVKSFFSFGSGSDATLKDYDFVDQTKTTESPPAQTAKTNTSAETVFPKRQRERSNALSNTAPARPKPQTAATRTPHANTYTAPATPKQQTAPAQTPQTSAQSTSASSTQQAAQSSEAPMSNEEKANKIIAKFEEKYAKNFTQSNSTTYIDPGKKIVDDKLDYCAELYKLPKSLSIRVVFRFGDSITSADNTFPLENSPNDIEKEIEKFLSGCVPSLRGQQTASRQQAAPQQAAPGTAPATPKQQTASTQTPHANTYTAPATPKQQTAAAQTPQSSAQSTSASSTEQEAQMQEKANKIIAKCEQKYAKNFLKSEDLQEDLQAGAEKKMVNDKLDYCVSLVKSGGKALMIEVFFRSGDSVVSRGEGLSLTDSSDDIEKKIEQRISRIVSSLSLKIPP